MAREPIPADVTGPQNDDDLNDALEDTFPASDPINMTMTGVGGPKDHPPHEPISPHTMGAAETGDAERTDDEGEPELQGDADLDPGMDRDPDLEESDDDVAQDPDSGHLSRS